MKYTLVIKKNRTIKYVLNKGEYKVGNYVVIHANRIKKNNSNINFFCVCVSKKNGNSVQRNKLKRWVREVYKTEENNIKKGNNIVILYKKTTNIYNTNFLKLQQDIVKCLKVLNIYEK